MPSAYLSSLSVEDRKALVKKLLETQKGKCFICEKKLDPDLHGAQIDIDEVIRLFELEKINRRNAAFDLNKCFWLNGQYILQMPLNRFVEGDLT